MQMGRTLTSDEHARVLAASRLPLNGQRAFAREFDPEVFKAWQGWVWGRQTFDLKIGAIDHAPAKVCRAFALEAIEYIARKRDDDKVARRATYRHEHDAPYAMIVSTAAGPVPADARAVSSRGVAQFDGPALFILGELVALEGRDENGDRQRWVRPCDGWILAGCPITDDMHVIRQGPARAFPPMWIVRGRSPYVLTDRGIDK